MSKNTAKKGINDFPPFSYRSGEHFKFRDRVEKAYSDDFMMDIYGLLSIDIDKQAQFRDYIIGNGLNFLEACHLNKDLTPPYQIKSILDKYVTALRTTQTKFKAITGNENVNSLFHNTLRDKIRESSPEMQTMFKPYMNVQGGDYDLWTRSEDSFYQFLDVLINTAQEAPNNIHEDYKAKIKSDFLLEWAVLMENTWSYFTDINFGIADWIKSDNAEDSSYKSACAGVLYDLLNAIDKEITLSEIETAIRKVYKKQ